MHHLLVLLISLCSARFTVLSPTSNQSPFSFPFYSIMAVCTPHALVLGKPRRSRWIVSFFGVSSATPLSPRCVFLHLILCCRHPCCSCLVVVVCIVVFRITVTRIVIVVDVIVVIAVVVAVVGVLVVVAFVVLISLIIA